MPASGQPVATCPALTSQGLPEAWQLIEAYTARAQMSGYWQQRRARQQLAWFEEALREGLLAQFYARVGAALPGVRQAVAQGRLSPWAAAGEMLRR